MKVGVESSSEHCLVVERTCFTNRAVFDKFMAMYKKVANELWPKVKKPLVKK